MIVQPRPRHWLLALALAGSVHALTMVRLGSVEQQVHRAQDPGAQSITIALAPPPRQAPVDPTPRAEPRPEPEPEPLESPVKAPEPEEKPEPEPQKAPEDMDEPEPEPEETPDDTPTEAADNQDQPARETAERRQEGATGGIQDAPPDYRTEVSAWLERHKEYPMSARRKAEQGMAMVSFTFDRDGRILHYVLLRPTGHASLDQAVEEMLDRADPLPRMPDHLKQARMTWTLPVYFRLN